MKPSSPLPGIPKHACSEYEYENPSFSPNVQTDSENYQELVKDHTNSPNDPDSSQHYQALIKNTDAVDMPLENNDEDADVYNEIDAPPEKDESVYTNDTLRIPLNCLTKIH